MSTADPSNLSDALKCIYNEALTMKAKDPNCPLLADVVRAEKALAVLRGRIIRQLKPLVE